MTVGDAHGHASEEMVSLAEAQAIVLSRCRALGRTELALPAAAGHVLAEPAVVDGDVPPFANSAMDGYAVVAADTAGAPVELTVTGVIAAGSAPSRSVARGEAMQIMTGAPLPAGADAIAIVERTERVAPETVRILDAVTAGSNIRTAGSDFASGSLALEAGTLIGPAQLGVLATAGLSRVTVWRRPRVGVVSTGDELVDPGAKLGPGQIRDSNRLVLAELVRRDGYEAVDLGVVRDKRRAVEEAVEAALGSCDAVLTSGGVSKGEFDFVKVVFDEMAKVTPGDESVQLSVAIRPAKPLAVAWLSRAGTPSVFFGLPGNPVSAMVSYQVIALPALRKMAGHPTPIAPALTAVAAHTLPPSRDGRLHLMRVVAEVTSSGTLRVRSAGGQQSHQMSGTTVANALALVPPGEPVPPGGLVATILFGPLSPESGRREGETTPAP